MQQNYLKFLIKLQTKEKILCSYSVRGNQKLSKACVVELLVAKYIVCVLRFSDELLDLIRLYIIFFSGGGWGSPSVTLTPTVIDIPAHDEELETTDLLRFGGSDHRRVPSVPKSFG